MNYAEHICDKRDEMGDPLRPDVARRGPMRHLPPLMVRPLRPGTVRAVPLLPRVGHEQSADSTTPS
jgi:hypothetical protein